MCVVSGDLSGQKNEKPKRPEKPHMINPSKLAPNWASTTWNVYKTNFKLKSNSIIIRGENQ